MSADGLLEGVVGVCVVSGPLLGKVEGDVLSHATINKDVSTSTVTSQRLVPQEQVINLEAS